MLRHDPRSRGVDPLTEVLTSFLAHVAVWSGGAGSPRSTLTTPLSHAGHRQCSRRHSGMRQPGLGRLGLPGLGADWLARRNTEAHTRRLVAQLEKLGHTVVLDPAT